MTDALKKLISSIIIMVLVTTGTMLTKEQLTALYQCHFWDGSVISTSTGTAEVKNNHLYIDGEDSGEIASIDPVERVTPKMEFIVESPDGHWDANYTQNELCLWFDNINNYGVSIIVPANDWTVKVEGDYIYAYDTDGNKLVRVNIYTSESHHYK